jgi:GTP-binding protein Era
MLHAPRMSNGTTRSGSVALIGRPNVGKSTLLNALVGEPLAITSPHPQTTREAVRGVLTKPTAQYVFIDTPGVHAPRTRLGRWMNDVAMRAARETDAVVLVAEVPRDVPPGANRGVASRDGRGEPMPNDADLKLASELPKRPTILALNKIDRLRDKAMLFPFIAAFNEAHPFTATVPLSARRKDGIDRLLDELHPLLPEQPPLYELDTLSDQPVRFFVAELVREQVLRHTRQEVPHGVAVVVERFDDGAVADGARRGQERDAKPPRIAVAIHVAREAHAKILVGAGGRMLKSIGIAARARIERMLGTRVYLELRVRTAPGWMDDEEQLRELGYGRRDAQGDR